MIYHSFLFQGIWAQGFAPVDIVGTFFKVAKSSTDLSEKLQLQFIKQIGLMQVNVLNGVDSFLQMSALVARLAKLGSSG